MAETTMGFTGVVVVSTTILQSALSVRPQVPEAVVEREPVYRSADEGFRIQRFDDAIMLDGDHFAVADGAAQIIYFASISDGMLAMVPAAAPDPSVPVVFPDRIEFLDRFLDGRLVAKRGRGWFTVFSREGEVLDSLPDRRVRGGPIPLKAFPDGSFVFETSQGPTSVGGVARQSFPSTGLTPRTVRYEFVKGGDRITIAEAPLLDLAEVTVPIGGSMHFQTARKIFGNAVYLVRSGQLLVVVATDRAEATAYDREGGVANVIPLPGGLLPVSEAEVIAQRYRRISEARLTGSTAWRMEMDAAIAEYARRQVGASVAPSVNKDSLVILQLPAKDTAPRIDRALADQAGRIWFRITPMPADGNTRWCVWNTFRQEYEFSLSLGREERLLDAFQNGLLLLATDPSGYHDVLVRRFAVPEHRTDPHPIHHPC